MMEFDLAGVREWGEKAIELAERLGETEVLVAATATWGRSSWPTGWPRAARSCSAAWSSRSTRGLEAPRGGRLLQPRVRAPTTSATTRRRWRTSRPGRAFCDEHDLLAWDTYLGGWEARIALDHGRWAEAAALAGENLERTRGSLPHSRFRSLLVVGVLHARRGDADPWPELDEALAIAVEANELDTLGPVARRRGRRRAGSPARPARSRRRPTTRWRAPSAATIAG